ncbi:MAG: hypothetical protein J6J38_01970 [Lachnospiraceae bacterium]|nr:hypothetical protein [Lachnospiraceae bacterium]
MCKTDNTWGIQVIETALQYANHEWTATEHNVLHGFDPDGVPVDTPDVTWKGEVLDCGWWKVGTVNKGVACGWGNASTIEEFDAGLLEGKLAGNVPEDKSRMGSRHSVGVDCSGLLTRCWNLPKKIATRDIPNYANKILLEEIRQGDVFAKVGSHVMFFIEFLDDEMKRVSIVDSTRSTGKVSVRELDVAELFASDYEVYRKKLEIN